MIKPQLHDVIEMLYSQPDSGLSAGAKGTIIGVFPDDYYEIEFVDDQGRTVDLDVLSRDAFIVVWRMTTQEAVALPDQVAQIVELLPDGQGTAVLDFARFLTSRQPKPA
jgi:hypothetical protein